MDMERQEKLEEMVCGLLTLAETYGKRAEAVRKTKPKTAVKVKRKNILTKTYVRTGWSFLKRARMFTSQIRLDRLRDAFYFRMHEIRKSLMNTQKMNQQIDIFLDAARRAAEAGKQDNMERLIAEAEKRAGLIDRDVCDEVEQVRKSLKFGSRLQLPSVLAVA